MYIHFSNLCIICFIITANHLFNHQQSSKIGINFTQKMLGFFAYCWHLVDILLKCLWIWWLTVTQFIYLTNNIKFFFINIVSKMLVLNLNIPLNLSVNTWPKRPPVCCTCKAYGSCVRGGSEGGVMTGRVLIERAQRWCHKSSIHWLYSCTGQHNRPYQSELWTAAETLRSARKNGRRTRRERKLLPASAGDTWKSPGRCESF